MPKQIIIAEQHRIGAVFGEDQIQELVVATGQHQVSDIYLGIVENVLPGIDAAFINIGDPSRNGFIHVTDLGPLRLRRSSGSIAELLAPQQKVLVQIMKEPTGNKGPRLTGNVSLPGRYVVLIPFGKGVNLSRRIRAESERNRLRALAVLAKPAGMGILVRTEAEGTPEDAILEDLELLQKQWEIVQQDANTTRAPALLNRDDDFIQRVLRDMYSADVNRIVVDSEPGLKRVKQTLQGWNDGQLPQGVVVDRHRERQPILEYFRVNAAIRESLKPRVDLPSGGYIIIEPTEALTVIDVNSGSFTRSNSSRETVRWTNYEAATEIARQLRLRNIAGVIIIDFIDMDYRKDQLEVLEHFNKQLRADKSRPQIAQLSELGLVELTRKRQGQNIYELFGETCSTCGGLGHLAHVPGETVYGADGEAVGISLVSSTPQREYRRSSDRVVRGLGRSAPRRTITPDSRQPAMANWNTVEPEGVETEDEFNLVNHPSYQERGGAGKKRRRRRDREEEGRSNALPRPIPNGVERPIPNGDANRPVRGRSGDAEPRPSREYVTTSDVPVRDPSLPTLIAASFAPPELEAYVPDEVSIDSAEERERPPKPQRIKPTRPTIEQPEQVAIEMSELEQETYAWMGISPLIKIDRELKNPKTAIVTIVPIGGLPPEPVTADAEIAVPSIPIATEAIAAAEEPTPSEPTEVAIEIEPTTLITVSPAVDADDADEPAVSPVVDAGDDLDLSAVGAGAAPGDAISEPTDGSLEPRRRKRRSSAVVD